MKKTIFVFALSMSAMTTATSANEIPNDASRANAVFRVELENQTPYQWFSPFLCALHDARLKLFETGQAATTGQATFAEDGFNGVLASELRQNERVYAVLQTAPGLTPPGATRIEYIEGPANARLTCAAMPVTTNDVLTVVSRVKPPRRLGISRVFPSTEWDLGSEHNSYSASAMPEDSVNLVAEGPDNPVTISENVVFGPGGRPTGVPSLLSPFTRAFTNAKGIVTAEGNMSVFRQYVGSRDFPPEVYGWSGSASQLTVTRIY